MFSNATIIAPRDNKPHIVLKLGYWRVSPKPRRFTGWGNARLWDFAHDFTSFHNSIARLAKQGRRYATPQEVSNMIARSRSNEHSS